MLRQAIFISCLLVSSILHSQTYLGLKTGGGGGWWLYESNAPNATGSAWDRSHFNINAPIEFSVEKQLGKRVRMGAYAFLSSVRDDEITESTDLSFNRDRVPIAEEWFSMLGGGIQGQYNIIKSGKYTLSGAGQVGFFHLNTIHPDENGFEKKYVFSVGPKLTIEKKKYEFLIHPNYTEYSFNNAYQTKGRHKMYFLNFMVGVNFKISDID